jgi:hypothetical protein
VNTAPEVAAAAAVFADTIHETISRCGDIDTFTMDLAEGQPIWFAIARGRTSTCGFVVALQRGLFAGQDAVVLGDSPLTPTQRHYTAPVTGEYHFTVTSSPVGSTADRDLPYVLFFEVPANEVAPQALAVGDTSDIEPYRDTLDLDLFTVPLTGGKEYVAATLGNVMFTTQTQGEGMQVSFEQYARGFLLPFTAPVTEARDFRIGLAGVANTPPSYRFMVHEFNKAPESIPALLPAGDTSAVEWMDHPGDEDHFISLRTSGQHFRVESFFTPGTTGALAAYLTTSDSSPIAQIEVSGAWQSPRFVVPDDGLVRLRLRGFLASADTLVNPGYRLRVIQINPAPETVGATLAPGDSILGEALDDPYDLDRYQFSVTATGTYAVRFTAPELCVSGAQALSLDVQTLAGANLATVQSRTDSATAGTVALTSGVTYRLVVTAEDPTLGNCLQRDYAVALSLAP